MVLFEGWIYIGGGGRGVFGIYLLVCCMLYVVLVLLFMWKYMEISGCGCGGSTQWIGMVKS